MTVFVALCGVVWCGRVALCDVVFTVIAFFSHFAFLHLRSVWCCVTVVVALCGVFVYEYCIILFLVI